MTYRLLASALDDLDHIDDWVSSNFGEAAALKARRSLNSAFERLAQFQQMGIERPDVTPQPVRFFSSPPNWIIYEPGQPLLIHRVFPARTDLRDLTL
jgi:plasmid stabilization system protein ParE